MNKKYCEYCLPTKRRSHLALHVDYYLDKAMIAVSKPLKYLFKKNGYNYQKYFGVMFLEFLSLFKIVNFVDKPDESKLFNRSLIFFKEAKKRNLNIKAIKILGKYKNEFKLVYKNKRYYYENIPLTIFQDANIEIDNKDIIKKILQKNNIPTIFGRLFTNADEALDFGNTIGFPLVVKPCSGSLSQHVTCPVISEAELINAIKIAKEYTPAFIVEKYIDGKLFRASVVGRSHVFACQKDKANIVGDGHSTIEGLINTKNTHTNRGDVGQMNSTLHKIPINDDLINNLKDRGLSLKSMLPKDEKIYLQNKFVLSHGCDIINCNEIVHDKNRELFLKVANILQSDLVGIDFICPDIGKSYEEQETAILETNSLPYIDMHQYPSHGNPDPVAETVWDMVLDKLAVK